MFYYRRYHFKNKLDHQCERIHEIFLVLIDYLPALRKMLKIHLLQVHGKGDIKRFGTLVDVNAELFEFTNLRGKVSYEKGNKISASRKLAEEEAKHQTCQFLLNEGHWFEQDANDLVTVGEEIRKMKRMQKTEQNNLMKSKKDEIRAALKELKEPEGGNLEYFQRVSWHGCISRSRFFQYEPNNQYGKMGGGIQYNGKNFFLLSQMKYCEIDPISLCDRYLLGPLVLVEEKSIVDTVNMVHDCAYHCCQEQGCKGSFYLLNRFHHRHHQLRLLDPDFFTEVQFQDFIRCYQKKDSQPFTESRDREYIPSETETGTSTETMTDPQDDPHDHQPEDPSLNKFADFADA